MEAVLFSSSPRAKDSRQDSQRIAYQSVLPKRKSKNSTAFSKSFPILKLSRPQLFIYLSLSGDKCSRYWW
ncbi:hypothetical protein VPHK71_0019 [Vibrio phage K71]